MYNAFNQRQYARSFPGVGWLVSISYKSSTGYDKSSHNFLDAFFETHDFQTPIYFFCSVPCVRSVAGASFFSWSSLNTSPRLLKLSGAIRFLCEEYIGQCTLSKIATMSR